MEGSTDTVFILLMEMVQVHPHIYRIWSGKISLMCRAAAVHLQPLSSPVPAVWATSIPASAKTKVDTRQVNPGKTGKDLTGHRSPEGCS